MTAPRSKDETQPLPKYLRATEERADYLAWVRRLTAHQQEATLDLGGSPSERHDP